MIVALAMFCSTAFADDFSLYYEATEGSQNNKIEAVANLQKITFEDGNIVITRKDGTTSKTAISLVKRLFFSTESVGIKEADIKEENAKKDKIYDLTGRTINVNLINELPKGIYIIDGKKVMVK